MTTNTTREALLAHPAVVNLPSAWIAASSDEALAGYIASIEEGQARIAAAQAAAEAERKAWRKPEWLIATDEVEGGKRTYRTEDGYVARAGNRSGRGRSDQASGWHLSGPGLRHAEHVTSLRQMVETIEYARDLVAGQ